MQTYHSKQPGGHPVWASEQRDRAQKKALPDLVCLSHLRWNFVYQRPQHLMVRWARERRVFFIEEPVFSLVTPEHPGLCFDRAGHLVITPQPSKVMVVTPHLSADLAAASKKHECAAAMQKLVDGLISGYKIEDYLLWYYTPMALTFTRHLTPRSIVYDCMDELSAFAGAPKELRTKEAELLSLADIVMTGGYSLYEAKRTQHINVHPFPSSVDQAHFAQARKAQPDPYDQASIGRPRLGFFGVIDERMDLGLLAEVATQRPNWQLVLLGPVVKIDQACLPRAKNIHYLGMKAYDALPSYLSGWDVALLPFARNEATRYISPTKTPEYLAAGKPVVSTGIEDVIRPYGQSGLVRIADNTPDFVAAIEAALCDGCTHLLPQIDAMLAQTSWDSTWQRMKWAIDDATRDRSGAQHRLGKRNGGADV